MAEGRSKPTVRYVRKYLILALAFVLSAMALLAYVVGVGPAAKVGPTITPAALVKACGGEALNAALDSEKSRFCYLEFFEKLLDDEGPKVAVAQLADWASKTGGLAGECHDVGHLLGKYAWKSLKERSLEGDTTVCAFSYGHGILQQASAELPQQEILRRFSNLCENTTDFPGCLHGYGHAMADIKFSPADSDALCARQVAQIDATKHSPRQLWNYHFTCMEGWVMEQTFIDFTFWEQLSAPEQAVTVCGDLQGPGGTGCRGSALRNYTMAPSIETPNFTEIRNTRLEEFQKICLTKVGDDQRGCMQHLGLTAAEVWTLDMPEKVTAPHFMKMCVGEFWVNCLESTLNSRWNRYGNSIERVLPLCAAFDEKYARQCEASLQRF